MKSPRGRRGFTLVEALIACVLIGLVMAALFSLLGTTVRGQAEGMDKASADNQAAMIGQALLLACEAASYVEYPPLGTVGAIEIRVWENTDPEDGISPILSSQPRVLSRFCADSDSNFFLYRAQAPAPAIECGAPPPTGVTRTQLNNLSLPGIVEPSFSRESNNRLRINYRVRLPPSWRHPAYILDRTTLIQLQQASL